MRDKLLTGEGRKEVGEEPNLTTTRKPLVLYQSSPELTLTLSPNL
jgi:hypothetical protein